MSIRQNVRIRQHTVERESKSPTSLFLPLLRSSNKKRIPKQNRQTSGKAGSVSPDPTVTSRVTIRYSKQKPWYRHAQRQLRFFFSLSPFDKQCKRINCFGMHRGNGRCPCVAFYLFAYYRKQFIKEQIGLFFLENREIYGFILRLHSTKCDARLAVNKKTNWLKFSRANEGQEREEGDSEAEE